MLALACKTRVGFSSDTIQSEIYKTVHVDSVYWVSNAFVIDLCVRKQVLRKCSTLQFRKWDKKDPKAKNLLFADICEILHVPWVYFQCCPFAAPAEVSPFAGWSKAISCGHHVTAVRNIFYPLYTSVQPPSWFWFRHTDRKLSTLTGVIVFSILCSVLLVQ